ncbi:MAG TPA: phosphoesterase [Planctomycetota bacterium]|nr:phosphoesterase [Planctomycetota bacterium]
MSVTARFSFALAVLVLSGATFAGTPTQLLIAAGNNQSALVNNPVPGVVCAVVRDASNQPVSGITVTFGNVTGGGSITGATQITDSSGIVTLGSWTLGPTPGVNTIDATSPGLPTITFTASAITGATLSIAAGNNQTAIAGTPVAGIVCARVTDNTGVPVQGIQVTFGDVTNGGSITGPVQITDATGVVTLGSWTLGSTPGVNTIKATSPGLNSIQFVATGVSAGSGNNIVIQWDNALLGAIARTKTTPPPAARAMAIVHTAIFDAWAAYDEKALGTQLGDSLRRPEAERTDANKQQAISYAAYRTLVDLFPAEKGAFDALMAQLGFDPANTGTDPVTPAGVGNAAAAAVIGFRNEDGSNQRGNLNPGAYSDYTSYMPKNTVDTLNDPSLWQPLPQPNGQPQIFLTPHWGLVKPFAIGDPAARKRLMPKPCAVHPSKKFQKQAEEVIELSAALDDRTKSIATYWADGGGTVTPPGHWCQIAQFISLRDKHTLDDDVKMFFALTNAMFDSSIAVWDCKVKYDSARPVTAIRFLFKGQSIEAYAGPGKGTQTILGEAFQSYIATPPFGEYVSGHSTFSSAGACILQLFSKSPDYGDSITITAGSSSVEPGVPVQDVTLSWKKLTDAAKEAGMSRLFGGIHFTDGNVQGQALGKKVAKLVFKKAQEYISGKVKK